MAVSISSRNCTTIPSSLTHRYLHISRDFSEELKKSVGQCTSELEKVNVNLKVEIAEHERAEEQCQRLNKVLEEKNRELEQIVYVTSHGLRSPLVNIQGFSKELSFSIEHISKLLLSDGIPEHVVAGLLETINEDISHAL